MAAYPWKDRAMTIFDVDEILYNKHGIICGVDEAGRGPLAGPVYAAAVILPRGCIIEGLNDSKKVTEKNRALLYDEICHKAVSYSIAWATEQEIDELNILAATILAMNRAIEGLDVRPNFALIDGNQSNGINLKNRPVVRGDEKYSCIAAASILAKVSRDRYMVELGRRYPRYGFERHKGYGTKLHYERLREYGPCLVHRVSFLRKWRLS